MSESLPSSAFAAGEQAGAAAVPPRHAALVRRVRAAEDRLFPLAMVDADRYQRAVLLVGLLARHLTQTCTSLDELAAGEDELADWLVTAAAAEGVPLRGLDVSIVVEAAMAQRLRALLVEQAAQLRQQTIEQARAAGLTWAVVEEPGPEAWSAGFARWVEMHVDGGAVLVRSVVADPRTGVPTYRLEVSVGADREMSDGERVAEFTDRDEWLAAADEARRTIASES